MNDIIISYRTNGCCTELSSDEQGYRITMSANDEALLEAHFGKLEDAAAMFEVLTLPVDDLYN